MRMSDLIVKKRDGQALTTEEIRYVVDGYTRGEIPDYQMSAMLMAIYFRGMDRRETLDLTMAMMHSGETLDLSGVSGVKADKHSSGRGLGHTGGTLDKLESIPGFNINLPMERFLENVDRVGMVIAGQTANLDPADKKLYALRDVTGTVPSIPLIVSSIMSKKLAAGADAIVLDVKTGSGAFMKSEEDAFALAEEMVTIGKNAGRQMHALITDMDQPLGYAIGNALEVKEAIATLNGSGPEDFTELVLALGSRMLIAGKKAEDVASAEKMLRQSIQNGDALRKLEAFVKAQGGTGEEVSHPEKLPAASMQIAVPSPQSGYISHIQCDEIGVCSLLLGGGRETKDSVIDLSVGLELKKKVGDYVEKGETLAVLHANDQEKAGQAEERFLRAYRFSETQPPKRPMIFGEI